VPGGTLCGPLAVGLELGYWMPGRYTTLKV